MRRHWALIVVALLLAALAGVLLAGRGIDASGSSLARGATGWMATRAYLQARGTPAELLTEPLDEVRPVTRGGGGPGTLVLAFPFQSHAGDGATDAVFRHLADGGDVLIGYSARSAPSAMEAQLLEDLDAAPAPLPQPPIQPARWRQAMASDWTVTTSSDWTAPIRPGAVPPALRLRPPRWLPTLRREHALLLGPEGRVIGAAWSLRGGRVVVLPSELLCNARLGSAPHAALLESLRRWLHAPWRFDELHHGLGPRTAAAGEGSAGRGLDLVLLQLLLIYLLAVLALGRRLGPAWRETPPLRGSAGAFLLRLGALHDRLGHHGEGATLLLRRAGELDRRFVARPELERRAQGGDAATLVELAREVAAAQRGGR